MKIDNLRPPPGTHDPVETPDVVRARTKIDLEDLERMSVKAQHPDQGDRERYLLAIEPPVTLALIARIRELEELGLLGIAAMEGLHDATSIGSRPAHIHRAKAILAKGAVLP